MRNSAIAFFSFLSLLLIAGILAEDIASLIEFSGLFLSNTASPFLATAFWIILPVVFLILLPLSFFRPLKPYCLIGILYSSYFFGLVTWVFGFIATYYTWGACAIIIGILCGVIGVIPIGVVAGLLSGDWPGFIIIFIGAAVSWSSRLYALSMLHKQER